MAKIYLGTVGSAQAAKTLLPPNNRQFSELTNDLRREATVASGKKVVDIIATKKTFTFNYNSITGPDIEIWLAFVGSTTWEIEVERRNGTYDKYSVRMSNETSNTLRKSVGDWLYEGVSFVLEEV